ncbi:MAG: protein translocase subunit SecF [Patescibacteria group bacterium]|jgi:preprotein translocase subunit SecF
MINLNIIKNRNIWLIFSGILVSLSIVSLFSWGLNFGIDFTGGNLLELKFSGQKPSVIEIREELKDLSLSSLTVQMTETDSVILRFKDDNPQIHKDIMDRLNSLSASLNVDSDKNSNIEVKMDEASPEVIIESDSGIKAEIIENDLSENNETFVEELRFDSVGPSIGKELKSKSFNTIFLVLIIIVLYISLVFRKVSRPVSSWKYGIAAIVALFHDVLIVLGVFAVLGRFYNTEINTPFIAAILTVLGYSVNDTIIVFDRIRENLPKSVDNFVDTINKSINQTLVRSLNTSFTTLLALIAIILFGGATIREFVLALAIGIFIGTYSSIFIASPILVWFSRKR